jgi:hypothetical protein
VIFSQKVYGMNTHMVFGFFALYVAATSLYMVLSGHQDAVLATLRCFWGRTIGHSLYFIARVALPMLICVFCLGWGVRNFDSAAVTDNVHVLTLNVDYYRDLMQSWQGEREIDSFDILYGA